MYPLCKPQRIHPTCVGDIVSFLRYGSTLRGEVSCIGKNSYWVDVKGRDTLQVDKKKTILITKKGTE